MPSRVSKRARSLSHRSPLDALLPRRHDHPVHVDAGRVDALGIEGADFDELLDLAQSRPRRHVTISV
jgi:hypothetical protein